MAQGENTCPKCEQQMQEGFVPDHYNYWSAWLGCWIEGPPELGFFGNRAKVLGKKRRPIATYRCPSCGYLEYYAK